MSQAGSEDSAQGLRWLAEARQLAACLAVLRHRGGQDMRSAALDMVGPLEAALLLAELAGPDRSEAGFLAACAAHSAAVELARLVEAGSAADPGGLGHVGWLIGRAHGLASAKVVTSRGKVGRPHGSGKDPWAPHIEKALRADPTLSTREVLDLLQRLGDTPPDASYINKVRKRLFPAGKK